LSYPIYLVRNNAPLEFLTGFTIEYPRIRKKWVENALDDLENIAQFM